MSDSPDRVLIRSKNCFHRCGIASSACGFSALTAALLLAFDQKINLIISGNFQRSTTQQLGSAAWRFRSINRCSHDESIQIADENQIWLILLQL
jgi:hypothetical protein